MTHVAEIRSTATFFLAVLYLSNLFLQSVWLNWFNICLLVLVLIPSLLEVRDTARLVGYSIFAVGVGLLLLYDAPFKVWIDGITRNLYLVVMFTLLPLLAIPIRQGGYMEALEEIFKRYANKESQFTLYVGILSFILGVMVNVGAITLMHQICLASEKSKNTRLLATSISRGFTASIIWAPSYATVALALELTKANWISMFPFGLMLGLTALFLGWLVKKLQERDTPESKTKNTETSSTNNEQIDYKKILELCIFSVILIVSIVIISHFTKITTVVVVALVSLTFPCLWLAAIGKLHTLPMEFKESYFRASLPKLKNETVLFIGAGVLSTSVMFSHLGELIPKLLLSVGGTNLVFFSTTVILTTVALGALGLHPIIFVTLIGSTVQASMYNISPTLLALILTSSWSLATTLSPSSANVIAMSGLINRSLLETGPKWNAKYILSLSLIFILMLNLMHLFGLM